MEVSVARRRSADGGELQKGEWGGEEKRNALFPMKVTDILRPRGAMSLEHVSDRSVSLLLPVESQTTHQCAVWTLFGIHSTK